MIGLGIGILYRQLALSFGGAFVDFLPLRYEVKKVRGNLVVVAISRAPKGQKFITGQVELTATGPADPNFKPQLTAALNKLDPQTPATQ